MPGPFGGQSKQRWGDNTISAGEYIRDIMLTDMTGRPTGTGDARRKGMVVLAFFTADDPTTPELLLMLRRLADGYKELNKSTVIGVSLSEREMTARVTGASGVKFPVLLDHDGYHAMIYGVTALPTVFLADGSGLVVKKMVGLDVAALEEMSAKISGFAGVDTIIPVTEDAPPVPAPPPPPPKT